jgi:hypothetical protein
MLLLDLYFFCLEHERSGELDGGVEGDRVWMTCTSCRAMIARALRDESARGLRR